jgi:hypothetical protein
MQPSGRPPPRRTVPSPAAPRSPRRACTELQGGAGQVCSPCGAGCRAVATGVLVASFGRGLVGGPQSCDGRSYYTAVPLCRAPVRPLPPPHTQVRNLSLGLAARGVDWAAQGGGGSLAMAGSLMVRLFGNLFQRSENIAQVRPLARMRGSRRSWHVGRGRPRVCVTSSPRRSTPPRSEGRARPCGHEACGRAGGVCCRVARRRRAAVRCPALPQAMLVRGFQGPDLHSPYLMKARPGIEPTRGLPAGCRCCTRVWRPEAL